MYPLANLLWSSFSLIGLLHLPELFQKPLTIFWRIIVVKNLKRAYFTKNFTHFSLKVSNTIFNTIVSFIFLNFFPFFRFQCRYDFVWVSRSVCVFWWQFGVKLSCWKLHCKILRKCILSWCFHSDMKQRVHQHNSIFQTLRVSLDHYKNF